MSGLVLGPAHATDLSGAYECTTGEPLVAESSAPIFTITNNVVNEGGSCVGAVEIPDGVTSIGEAAFAGATALTSITIPESVTSIGEAAFVGSALTSIDIPASVTSIGEGAFAGATSLKTVTFGSGSQLTSISDYMFTGAELLSSITIPVSVTSIGEVAFAGTALTSITIPASVTSIGEGAFVGSSLQLVNFESGSKLTSIGPFAFEDNYSLTEITIPASVTSIGEGAFWNATDETIFNFLGPAPDAMGSFDTDGDPGRAIVRFADATYALNETDSTWNGLIVEHADYTAPDGYYLCSTGAITTTGTPTYRVLDGEITLGGSCAGAIVIPDGVTSIGESAFAGATALTSITIPESVTEIYNYAFDGATALTRITVDGANDNYSSVAGVLFNKAATELIRYPARKRGTSYTIPASVQYINYGAFAGATALTSITIPAGVTSIRGGAFAGATALTSITIQEGVKEIWFEAFAGTALTSIAIPSSVNYMQPGAFAGATALTSITVDAENADYSEADGVLFDKAATTLISYPAGKTLPSYAIPEGVNSIWPNAFAGIIKLTDLTLPASLTIIKNYAFDGATALTSITVDAENADYSEADGVLFDKAATELIRYPAGKSGPYTIPEGVTTIGESAFAGATALTSITIPEGVTSIGSYAFTGATALTDLTLPASLTTINNYAFDGATALTRITVNEEIGVTPSDDFSAVEGVLFNKAATELIRYPAGKSGPYTIPEGVTSIGNVAFAGATALTSITIPEGVTSIGSYAFTGAIALTSITIPTSVTTINSGAFFYTTALTTVTFKPGSQLTSIGDNAFAYATALTSITIPASVTSIGEEDAAFLNASSLSSVYFMGQAPEAARTSFFGVSSGAKAYINSGITSFGSAGVGWQGLVVTVGFYSVTYNTNGGSVVTTQSHGANIPTPTSPTRTGYTFAGWSATDGGSVITFPYTPASTGDITLYAKWTVIPAVDTPAPAVDNSLSLAAELSARTIGFKKSFSAKSLGKQIGVAIISPKATVSLSVAKASKKVCTKSGSKLKTLKAGNCEVTFTVQEPKPKKGKKPKATKTTTTLVVQ